MTNATKTLSIIFAGTVALALVTSLSWSGSSSAAFQQELLAVDTSQVQAVRIERSDAPSVRLHQTADGWSVVPEDTAAEYPADAQSVRRLLSRVPSLNVSAVATRQPDKHPRYGVDSTGTRVTLLGTDDEPLGGLIVGRTRMQQPQSGGQRQRRPRMNQGTLLTYVRSPDQPDVYSVQQSLPSVVNQSITDWREKQLWAVNRSQIQRVEFDYPADSSFVIERASSPDTAQTTSDSWISEGDTLDTSSVSALLRRLTSPQADGFVDGMSPDNFGTTQYTLRLQLNDGSQRRIRLRPAASGDAYAAAVDGFPYVVHLQKSQWDQNVLQGRSAFLRSE